MELCSKSHDEVCYDGSECPVCQLRESKDEKIEDLQNRISELETIIKECPF